MTKPAGTPHIVHERRRNKVQADESSKAVGMSTLILISSAENVFDTCGEFPASDRSRSHGRDLKRWMQLGTEGMNLQTSATQGHMQDDNYRED